VQYPGQAKTGQESSRIETFALKAYVLRWSVRYTTCTGVCITSALLEIAVEWTLDVMPDLLQQVPERMNPRSDIVRGNWIALDRLGAAREAVEHPSDPKVIRREVFTRLVHSVNVGVCFSHW
jgi:hypothetical protein